MPRHGTTKMDDFHDEWSALKTHARLAVGPRLRRWPAQQNLNASEATTKLGSAPPTAVAGSMTRMKDWLNTRGSQSKSLEWITVVDGGASSP